MPATLQVFTLVQQKKEWKKYDPSVSYNPLAKGSKIYSAGQTNAMGNSNLLPEYIFLQLVG